jgi:hypothetical protein
MRLGAVELVVAFCLYFIPTVIAVSRKHRNVAGIFFLNLLLGWTILGWIGAFVWSFVSPSQQPRIVTPSQATVVVNNNQYHNQGESYKTRNFEADFDSKMAQLERLKRLYDAGALSESEFAKEKARILD